MRAVTTALKSKQAIEEESKPRPDPQAAITKKLLAYGSRNKRQPSTFVDDEDKVEELSKETGVASKPLHNAQSPAHLMMLLLQFACFHHESTIVLLSAVYDHIGDEFCRKFVTCFIALP